MLERVKQILISEARAIENIPVTENIEKAVRAMLNCKGKVFTTGIGKAGYVAKKTASTLSTTGTPSVFLHPGDAPHGDVGVVCRGDLLLTYSNSGRTREVIETVHHAKHLGVDCVISITASAASPLGELSDIVLEIGEIEEPCPLGLTPTASTSAMIALSDALALTVMSERGFSKEDFAVRHHGGYLGIVSRQ
ncbi:MAG: SIS domain-containing protein [bacterium]|nr:SIS domain-containing protein [bacterium]